MFLELSYVAWCGESLNWFYKLCALYLQLAGAVKGCQWWHVMIVTLQTHFTISLHLRNVNMILRPYQSRKREEFWWTRCITFPTQLQITIQSKGGYFYRQSPRSQFFFSSMISKYLRPSSIECLNILFMLTLDVSPQLLITKSCPVCPLY